LATQGKICFSIVSAIVAVAAWFAKPAKPSDAKWFSLGASDPLFALVSGRFGMLAIRITIGIAALVVNAMVWWSG
jgi:hypothetical protein